MNWQFEASHDKVNWTVLDRRIYMTGNADEDLQHLEIQKQLCQKGQTSTWGIDTELYRELGFDGFRYFRIVQIGRNSSGSHNLALSGFEMYGKPTKGRWP